MAEIATVLGSQCLFVATGGVAGVVVGFGGIWGHEKREERGGSIVVVDGGGVGRWSG